MRLPALSALLFLVAGATPAGGQVAAPPAAPEQVRQAVLAAPPSLREGATVLGYGGAVRTDDPLTVLRQGTNELICLADDPAEEGFHVACYQSSLDPYMRLGRRLRAQGMARSEVMDARYAALEQGTLVMPGRAALYSVTADTGPEDLEGARRLVVVYVPGATTAEIGLPGRPEGDSPWLMLPGTPWAHIMIGR
jgi:hypothetical protein